MPLAELGVGVPIRTGAEFPKTPLQVTHFVERAVDWLPREYERLHWLSDLENARGTLLSMPKNAHRGSTRSAATASEKIRG